MTEVNRFHIYTSSAQKTHGKIEDYNVILRRPIILTNPHHYFKVIVKEVTIPYTFQQVNTNFNSFSYILTRGATTYPQRTFQITNGNYNINSLLTELKTKLLNDINVIVPSFTPTFTFTYDRNNMFVTFSMSGDATASSIQIIALKDQINTMVGVVNNSTFGYNGATATTCTSSQPVNISPITSIYVRSDTLKQNYMSTENIVREDSSDILCQVPILNQPTSWIQYLNDLSIENRINNDIINDLNLYLTDNRSYSLDLRGIDWSCLLTIIEYEPPLDDSFHQIRKDIKNNVGMVNDVMSNDVEFKKGIPIPISNNESLTKTPENPKSSN